MAVRERDAPLEPERCRAGRNRTSEAGDLGFPAGGGEFWNGGGGVGGHWEKRRRVRCEEKQPGDGDSGCPVGPPPGSRTHGIGVSKAGGHWAKKEKILWFGWAFRLNWNERTLGFCKANIYYEPRDQIFFLGSLCFF